MQEGDSDMRNRGTRHRGLTNPTLDCRVARRRLSSCLLASATLLVALVALPSRARTATIWFDSDGDGLPQQGNLLAVSNGADLTLDVWINSGSFQWTNYLLYLEWDGCLSLSDPEYVMAGGTNFPIDDFTKPSTIGFGGSGFNEHGSDLIGRVSVQINSPSGCCIKPVIELDEDYNVVTQLGYGESYRLFEDTDGLCFESLDSRQERSWGGVKGLYK